MRPQAAERVGQTTTTSAFLHEHFRRCSPVQVLDDNDSSDIRTYTVKIMSRCFVTVGSTQFDPVVDAALSPLTLDTLRLKGFKSLVIQCGKYEAADSLRPQISEGPWEWTDSDVHIIIFRYKPSLHEEYGKADLVISHAGSGTILDVLRRRIPLIVVPNPTLLDNHQEDLASELHERGHLKACTVDTLAQAIGALDVSTIVPFPQQDKSKFQAILDEMMGFT